MKWNISGKVFDGTLMLFVVGITRPDPNRPLWLYLEIVTTGFLFGVSLDDGVTSIGTKYWSAALWLGILRLRASRTKACSPTA